MKNKVSDIR